VQDIECCINQMNKGKMMKNWLIGLACVVLLSACVTINIYFPAAAAEKAADKIIDEVWQLKQEGNKSNADAPTK
jgi:hypothetical protein